MNNVNLIGRLANDPELSYTPSGATVAHFDLAVPKKSSDRNAPPNYIGVTCWNHTAEFANKYLTKGRQIALAGRLDTSKWRDKFDQNRKDTYVVADNIEPLGPAKSRDNGGAAEDPGPDYGDGSYFDGGGYEGP